MNKVSASARFAWLLLFPVLVLSAACLSCRKEEPGFGAGQRAQKKEAELRNKTLLEQFVIASEELENHPDPAYLESALLRLNPWLESAASSRDFRPDPEYAARAEEFLALSQTAGEIDALCAKAANRAEGAGLTEDEARLLPEKLDLFLDRIGCLNALYHSALLSRFGALAADLKKGVSEAGTFQFGDRAKMVSSAVSRFSFTPLMNFRVLAAGAAKTAGLYRLDSRAFFPEDTSHFKSSVWERNIAAWAKGNASSPAEQALSLFRWTCDVIPLDDAPAKSGTAEAIPRQPWQTLLTSQGTGAERAAVFMGLLRQIGMTSFLVKPADPANEEGFPLIVGAAVPADAGTDILLFLPEYGVPIPGVEGPVLETDPARPRGLSFPSVATLDQAAQNDGLLRRLDLETAPFPLTAADLQNIRAALPTDMFNLSERMWIMMRESVIERADAQGGAASFVPPILAMSPESARGELGILPHISSVVHAWELQTPVIEQVILPVTSQLLLLPYLYEVPASGGLSMRADDESSRKFAPAEGAGSGPGEDTAAQAKMICPLWEGKILYFKGLFDTEQGAANRLQQGRVPDRLLKQESMQIGSRLEEYISRVQQDQGDGNPPLTEEQVRAAAAQFVGQARQDIGMKLYLKVTARFYLGLVSYALRNGAAALTHFEDADLLDKLDGLWKSGALTLIAEIYESQGDFARAQKIYTRLEGAAAPGGGLRAKWIAEALASAPAEAPSAPEAEPGPAEE